MRSGSKNGIASVATILSSCKKQKCWDIWASIWIRRQSFFTYMLSRIGSWSFQKPTKTGNSLNSKGSSWRDKFLSMRKRWGVKSNVLILRKLNFKKNPIALLVRLLSSIKMYIVICNKMCFYLKTILSVFYYTYFYAIIVLYYIIQG